MSNVLTLPASMSGFYPAGDSSEQTWVPVDEPAGLEERLRSELEEQYRHRLAEELEQQDRRIRGHCENLFRSCSAKLDKTVTALRHEIETKVIDFSLSLAEVVVRHRLPDRDMLHALIAETLKPVSDLQGISVHVCPQDHALLGDEVFSNIHGIQSAVELVCDPKLCSGDVIVESRNGIFDARLDERLELLKETLYERSGRQSNAATEG